MLLVRESKVVAWKKNEQFIASLESDASDCVDSQVVVLFLEITVQ